MRLLECLCAKNPAVIQVDDGGDADDCQLATTPTPWKAMNADCERTSESGSGSGGGSGGKEMKGARAP